MARTWVRARNADHVDADRLLFEGLPDRSAVRYPSETSNLDTG
jgi:hypothetical protein